MAGGVRRRMSAEVGAGCCGSDPCCPEWSNVEHEEGRSSTTGGVWSPVESTWEYPAGGCYWQKNSKLVRKNRPSLFLYPTQINGFEQWYWSALKKISKRAARSQSFGSQLCWEGKTYQEKTAFALYWRIWVKTIKWQTYSCSKCDGVWVTLNDQHLY